MVPPPGQEEQERMAALGKAERPLAKTQRRKGTPSKATNRKNQKERARLADGARSGFLPFLFLFAFLGALARGLLPSCCVLFSVSSVPRWFVVSHHPVLGP